MSTKQSLKYEINSADVVVVECFGSSGAEFNPGSSISLRHTSFINLPAIQYLSFKAKARTSRTSHIVADVIAVVAAVVLPTLNIILKTLHDTQHWSVFSRAQIGILNSVLKSQDAPDASHVLVRPA